MRLLPLLRVGRADGVQLNLTASDATAWEGCARNQKINVACARGAFVFGRTAHNMLVKRSMVWRREYMKRIWMVFIALGAMALLSGCWSAAPEPTAAPTLAPTATPAPTEMPAPTAQEAATAAPVLPTEGPTDYTATPSETASASEPAATAGTAATGVS